MKNFLIVLLILSIPLDSNYYFIHQGLFHYGFTNGISITFVDILLFFLYFILIFGEKKQEIRWPKAATPALGFILVAMLSMVDAPVKRLSFYLIILLIKAFFLFFFAANSIKTRKDINLIVASLLASLGVQSILTLIQLHTGKAYSLHFFLSKGYLKLQGHISRSIGTFSAVAPLASFLAILVTLAMGIFINPLLKTYKKLCAILVALGIIALILSLSRGAWIGFAISLVVLTWFFKKMKVVKFNRLFFALIFVSLLAVLFSGTISERFEDPQAKHSADARIPLMEMAWGIITENPILGIGANNYYRAIVNKEFGVWKYVVHNQYLLVWAEMGTIGFFFYLWFLVSVIRSGLRASMADDTFLSTVAVSLLAGLIGHAFHQLVDLFTGDNFVYFFWFICGLLVGLEQFEEVRKDDILAIDTTATTPNYA